jgi:UTP---glucose-1-phosphate uridylyltransferase
LNRKKILVRQINNPIAGVDYGILAFCGIGFGEDKVFGFASCPRQVKSAEGVNVLIERTFPTHSNYCLTNIEYCDFQKFDIQDVPVELGSTYSQFPSNTNILFADIAAIKQTVAKCPIPGMLVNLKKISFNDEQGQLVEREVARLESTMQNIADCFEHSAPSTLSTDDLKLNTYLTYNYRGKTISTTKKLFQPGSSLLETPEGCFYDLLQNAHDLLSNYCGVALPSMPDAASYIEQGPPFLFSYHPALGPLYSIIAQKIQGGTFVQNSELKLEIAEVSIVNLTLSGSLHVIAYQVVGEKAANGVLHYSENVGRCRLINVIVRNEGYLPHVSSHYWKAEINRRELCEIVLHGDGEFFAENVALTGNMKIEVESGSRLIAFDDNGELKFKKEPLSGSKNWVYHLSDDGSILLE